MNFICITTPGEVQAMASCSSVSYQWALSSSAVGVGVWRCVCGGWVGWSGWKASGPACSLYPQLGKAFGLSFAPLFHIFLPFLEQAWLIFQVQAWNTFVLYIIYQGKRIYKWFLVGFSWEGSFIFLMLQKPSQMPYFCQILYMSCRSKMCKPFSWLFS